MTENIEDMDEEEILGKEKEYTLECPNCGNHKKIILWETVIENNEDWTLSCYECEDVEMELIKLNKWKIIDEKVVEEIK